MDGGDFGTDTQSVTAAQQIEEITIVLKVLVIRGFETGKTDCLQNEKTKNGTYSAGQMIQKLLDQLPQGYFIVVTGHADKKGRDFVMPGTGVKYNDFLAQKRAESVAAYIVKNFNLTPDKLKAGGAGDRHDERKVTFAVRKE